MRRKRDHRNDNEEKQCNMSFGDFAVICKQYPGKSSFLVGDNFQRFRGWDGLQFLSYLLRQLIEESPPLTMAERDNVTARGR